MATAGGTARPARFGPPPPGWCCWATGWPATRSRWWGWSPPGCYWKPVYYLLEDDVECWLLNAQHLKNVPGRKTDVADAAWIAQLVEHGLVRPSFVPPRPIRELRELTRYRKALIYERTREAQRLHKVLEDAGIKLACVASDVLGVSGRAMLEALVGGTTDPEVLAELARGRLRKQAAGVAGGAGQGRVARHHRLLVAEMLAHLDYLEEAIGRLSARGRAGDRPVLAAAGVADDDPGGGPADRRGHPGRDRRRHGPLPHRGASGQLGGAVPGQQRVGRQALLGQDPQGLQVAADHAEPGGQRRRPQPRAPTWPPTTPGIKGRRGHKKAIVAVAHSILVIAWHLLTRNQPYTDLGADYFLERQTARPTGTGWCASSNAWATRSPWSRPRSPDPVPHQGHRPLDGDFQPRHIRGMRSSWLERGTASSSARWE